MTTKAKLALIATTALALLTIRWAVSHTYTLILLFAIVTTVAVVAGPTITRITRKARKALKPNSITNEQLDAATRIGNHTQGADVDWDALVREYKLPTER